MKTYPAPFPDEVLAMLGKVSDYVIANQFGLKRSSVMGLRRKLRIKPAYPARRHFHWTAAKLARFRATLPLEAADERYP